MIFRGLDLGLKLIKEINGIIRYRKLYICIKNREFIIEVNN